jgi:hypothetical protein
MSAHLMTRVRRYVRRSAALQILLFVVITIVVLLVAEYTGIFPARSGNLGIQNADQPYPPDSRTTVASGLRR